MTLMNPIQLRAQGVVVWLVVLSLAIADFIGRGCLACEINIRAVESCRGTQAGRVLSGVKRLIRRVAVGIDDVAMQRGADDCNLGNQVGIEARDMSIGIGAHLALRVEARENRVWNIETAVWLGQQQRPLADRHIGFHGCSFGSNPSSTRGLMMLRSITNCLMAAISSAR